VLTIAGPWLRSLAPTERRFRATFRLAEPVMVISLVPPFGGAR
jgi:hypothetical protein